jgi:hypothetical protein
MKKLTIAAATAAALFAGAAQAGDTEFIIYKGPDFRGANEVVNGEVANLERGFAGEGSSFVVKGGYWEVCDQDHFKGDCRVIAAGQYPRLGRDWNNRIVSVRFLGADQKFAARVYKQQNVAANDVRSDGRDQRRYDDRADSRHSRGQIELYNGQDFRGRSIVVDREARDLADMSFDGRASSVVVREGTWELCSEPRFEGKCVTYRPGDYRYLASMNDRVNSARQVR